MKKHGLRLLCLALALIVLFVQAAAEQEIATPTDLTEEAAVGSYDNLAQDLAFTCGYAAVLEDAVLLDDAGAAVAAVYAGQAVYVSDRQTHNARVWVSVDGQAVSGLLPLTELRAMDETAASLLIKQLEMMRAVNHQGHFLTEAAAVAVTAEPTAEPSATPAPTAGSSSRKPFSGKAAPSGLKSRASLEHFEAYMPFPGYSSMAFAYVPYNSVPVNEHIGYDVAYRMFSYEDIVYGLIAYSYCATDTEIEAMLTEQYAAVITGVSPSGLKYWRGTGYNPELGIFGRSFLFNYKGLTHEIVCESLTYEGLEFADGLMKTVNNAPTPTPTLAPTPTPAPTPTHGPAPANAVLFPDGVAYISLPSNWKLDAAACSATAKVYTNGAGHVTLSKYDDQVHSIEMVSYNVLTSVYLEDDVRTSIHGLPYAYVLYNKGGDANHRDLFVAFAAGGKTFLITATDVEDPAEIRRLLNQCTSLGECDPTPDSTPNPTPAPTPTLTPDPTSDPAHTPGDINGDSVIDGRDSIRLQKYLAGADVTILEANADVNADSVIDGRDSIRLQKYLAGADVVLK